jgi:hypothetical protein
MMVLSLVEASDILFILGADQSAANAIVPIPLREAMPDNPPIA